MNRWLLALVATAAIAAALWLALREDDAGGGDELLALRDGVEQEVPEARDPMLRGAATSTVPVGLRGGGAVVGRVERGGRGEAARVALYHVTRFESGDPLGASRDSSFIARILDAGLATGPVLARADTQGDGAFAFEGLRTGVYEVHAVAGDGAAARTSATVPAGGARVEALLELPDGGESLAGRVLQADGSPFGGCTVVAESGGAMSGYFGLAPRAIVTQADADGRFTFGGLTAGEVLLSVIQPGVLRLFGISTPVPRPDEIEIRVAGGAVKRRGRVFDSASGEGIAGARVTGGGGTQSSGILLVQTRTGADGRFMLNVLDGQTGAFVEADGYAPQTGQWQGDPEEELALGMLRTARVSGRVTQKENGEVVAGVWVYVLPELGSFGPSFPSAGRTDGSGRYTIEGVAPGTAMVFALGAGWASPHLETDESMSLQHELPSGESSEIDLVVEPSGRLVGDVKTHAGHPVAGAVVELGGDSPLDERLQMLSSFTGTRPGSVVTDAQGRFHVDALGPDLEYEVRVRAVGHPLWSQDGLTAASGETKTLEVRLAAPRWLTLEVRSSAGGVLAGATVSAARRGDDDWEMLPGTWTTNDAGTARVGPIPHAVIGVQVIATEHVSLEEFEEVATAGAADAEATVTLEQGLELRGRILLPEGARAQSAEVTISNFSSASNRFVWVQARIEEDGSWRVGGLPPGVYDVEARLEWQDGRYEHASRAEAGRDDVEVDLTERRERPAGLVVHVLDPQGQKVARGVIAVLKLGGEWEGTNTTVFSSGRAELRDELEDAKAVHLAVYGVAGGRLGAATLGPIARDAGEVEIRLPPEQGIAGQVVGPNGKGVARVRVEAYALAPDGTDWTKHAHATTDETGTFRVGGLGDLPYRLLVTAPRDYAPVEPVLTRGGASDLCITLAAGREVRIQVVDWEDKPVAKARVRVWIPQEGDDPAPTWVENTDGQGVVVLRGLPAAGPFSLSASPPQSRNDLRQHEEEDWAAADAILRLKRAWTVSGRVVDLHGEPIAEVPVYAEQGADFEYAETDESGRFEVEDLVEGEVTLRATIGHGMEVPESEAVTCRAGAKEVVLRLDPGIELVVDLGGWSPMWSEALLQSVTPGIEDKREADVTAGGHVRFRGLNGSARYALWIHPQFDDDNAYAYAEDVDPRAGTIQVEVKQGTAIRGRVVLPVGKPPHMMGVTAEVHGFDVSGDVEKDGTFEIRGVPAGTWPVRAVSWSQDGRKMEARTTAVAGGEAVEISLR